MWGGGVVAQVRGRAHLRRAVAPSALRRRVLASSRAPEQDQLANLPLTPTSDAKAATTFFRHGHGTLVLVSLRR